MVLVTPKEPDHRSPILDLPSFDNTRSCTLTMVDSIEQIECPKCGEKSRPALSGKDLKDWEDAGAFLTKSGPLRWTHQTPGIKDHGGVFVLADQYASRGVGYAVAPVDFDFFSSWDVGDVWQLEEPREKEAADD
jgi:hypothetical protein